MRRILATLAAVATYLVLRQVPVPGILDFQGFSIVELGLQAFVAAALVVELIGWAMARASTTRRAEFRARWVPRVAMALAMVQAASVVAWGLDIGVLEPGVGPMLLAWGSLVAGFGVLLLGVGLVTRHGVAHGYVVWVVVDLALTLGEALQRRAFVAGLIQVALLALGAVLASQAFARSRSMRFPPSGVLPLQLVALTTYTGLHPILRVALVGLLALALGWYAHPGKQAPVERGHIEGALGLVAMFVLTHLIVPDALGAWREEAIGWSAAGLFLASSAILDLVAEVRFRAKQGALASLGAEQSIDVAEALAGRLTEAGIPVLLRSVQHRAMLQWLGPFVPVEVMVPAQALQAARELASARADGFRVAPEA